MKANDHDTISHCPSPHQNSATSEQLAKTLEAYLRAVEAGDSIDRGVLLQEHPQIGPTLNECLDVLDFVRAAAPQFKMDRAPGEPAPFEVASSATLGDYELLREIGRGGMGVVYEARQISLNRTVALKVLPFAAMLDPRHLQRFRNEALAAANLDHPNIVDVLGVGCERGVHFYVMRFIPGTTLAAAIAPPIDPAPATTPLALDTAPNAALHTLRTERMSEYYRRVAELGIQAAEALEHAHQVGVVHRDIKPSNLLLDPRGKLWVTDFGLAQVDSQTTLTLPGDLLGTLRYMSPEQAAGRPTMVDHRTDLYSLGATLYEAATGRPVVVGQERAEVLREIAEKEPTSARKHSPDMPADLETILLKCLAKEPSARYESAQALADDLRRFLEHKPVVARRPSVVVQARKFVRRHRALTAAVSTTIAALLLGVLGTTWGMFRATEAEKLAEQERDKAIKQAQLAREEGAVAKAIGEFLQHGLLMQAAPESNPHDRPLTVAELLDRAALSIDGQFTGQPKIEAALRKTMGDAYFALEKYPQARLQWERAVAINRASLGETHRDTLEILSNLAEVHRLRGQVTEAESMAVRVLDATRSTLGNSDELTLTSMNSLASVYASQNRHAEAALLLEESLPLLRQLLGPNDPVVLSVTNNLASVYASLGRDAEAESLFRDAFGVSERTLGARHPDTLSAMNNLAVYAKEHGKFPEAEKLFKDTLELNRKVFGPESPSTLTAMNNLASCYFDRGEYIEAEPRFIETLELVRRVQGESHPHTMATTNYLSKIYLALGKPAECEKLVRQAMKDGLDTDGPDFTHPATFILDLVRAFGAQNKHSEAQDALRDLQGLIGPIGLVPPEAMPLAAEINSMMGGLLARRGRFEEAEPLLRTSYETLKSLPDAPQELRQDALQRLIDFACLANRPEEAAAWRAEAHYAKGFGQQGVVTISEATPLNGGATEWTGGGFVGARGDVDWFSFDVPEPVNLRIAASGPAGVQAVKVAIELRDANGALVAASESSDSVQTLKFDVKPRDASGALITFSESAVGAEASLTRNLSGKCFVGVQSHSVYGRIGQFTIQVTESRPGVIATSTTAPRATSELGRRESMTMVLQSRPTSEVSFRIESSKLNEGLPSMSAMVFTPENWYEPQTLTVIGVDDSVLDGAQAYAVGIAPAESADPAYHGLIAPSDLSLVNLDASAGQAYWLARLPDRTAVIQCATVSGDQARTVLNLSHALGASPKDAYSPTKMTIDPVGRKMYWTDTGADAIYRANLDGSEAESIATGLAEPAGVAIDPGSAMLYWVESGTKTIWRSSLDGGDREKIHVPGADVQFYGEIEVDAAAGKLYWADNRGFAIYRANLNGTGIETVIPSDGIHRPSGLELDLAGGKLYFSLRKNYRSSSLYRANLNGSDRELLLEQDSIDAAFATTNVLALAIDHQGERLLWSDGMCGRVYSADLDGKNVAIVAEGVAPFGLSVLPSDPINSASPTRSESTTEDGATAPTVRTPRVASPSAAIDPSHLFEPTESNAAIRSDDASVEDESQR